MKEAIFAWELVPGIGVSKLSSIGNQAHICFCIDSEVRVFFTYLHDSKKP